jgi:hypothetical protein
MEFDFEVGKDEKHKIHFTHDLFWGRFMACVDGLNIPIEGVPGISLNPYFVRAFLIGDPEKHEIRVQIIRPGVFAGFRKDWKYTTYIDGKEYKTFYG